ncbi:MAG: PD-(D/E)XK nuclease family protein [Acidimicrobiales bacterium]
MIDLVDAPLGRGALAALRDTLRGYKADHPLAPVTVLVDDNAVGVATRRALASGDLGPICGDRPGLAAVSFSTIYRYGELLGAPVLAAAGRRPVSTPAVAAAIRRVLAEHAGVFSAVADHPTTERRLVAAHRELAELDPEQLDAIAAAGSRAAAVIDIHRRTKAALAEAWYGEQDLLAAASEVLVRERPDVEPVVVYLPRELSPSRATLLRHLGRRTPVTVIAGRSGLDDADHIVAVALERLGLSLPAADPVPHRGALSVTSVSDPDDEVRHALRGVVSAARAGVPLDRMAVVYGAPEPYARLLHDHLAAAGIPTNGAAVASLAASLAGRTLLRLLDLAERGFRRDDVIDLVAGTPMRWNGRPVPSRAWDEISRAAGIVRGRRQWHDRLTRLREDEHARLAAWQDDPEGNDRTARIERRITTIDELMRFVEGLAQRLDAGSTAQRWSELAEWARVLLADHLDGHDSWPEVERRAHERIEGALARLGSLDEVDPAPSLAVFRRSLELELDAGLGRAGSSGSGLLVGTPALAVGNQLSQVWVLGMAEGTFPAVGRDDSLLPDHERRLAPDLARSTDRSARQHLDYLAVLAAAADGTAHLLYPRGDLRRSESRTPSRWLLETLGDHLDRRVGSDELAGLDHPLVHHVPSFASAVVAGPAATSNEFDLASLVENPAEAGADLAADDPVLARGAAMLAGRRSAALTRFDGLVGDAGPGRPTLDQPLSATSLERWARCPHGYFLQRVLGVEAIEAPEQRLRLDALDRGTLVHRILERFVAERPVADATGWDAADRDRLERIATEECDAVEARGLTGEPVYWRRDRATILRDLRGAIAADDQRRREQGCRPYATELAFGFGGARPVVVELPDGHAIAVRGSIDLVDRRGDELVVTDYKTGRKGKTLDGSDPHQGGTRLQLVLYALAARRLLAADGLCTPDAAVESRYWHLHRATPYAENGYVVTTEIRDEVLRAIAEIVDMIAAGLFPQHPVPTTRHGWVDCEWCDPDGLGVGDARRRMERKADDPLLMRYLTLAEPEVVGR